MIGASYNFPAIVIVTASRVCSVLMFQCAGTVKALVPAVIRFALDFLVSVLSRIA